MPSVLRNRAAKAGASRSSRARVIACFAGIGLGALAISSCTVSGVLTPRVDVGARTAYVAPVRLGRVEEMPNRLEPFGPVERLGPVEQPGPVGVVSVAYPRLTRPLATPGNAMPADEVACRERLRELGVTYRNLPPIDDGGACRIDYPVEVSMLSGNIDMKPDATLTCDMAAAFALWTRNELASAARWKYFSGVKTIHQGSSYSCRNIAGTRTASEHSKGNALDVMRIELENGRDIDVRKPGWFAFRKRSLLKSVRSGGCEYFTTVLGPGYNADHADHFHFDIKNRRNGYVACR